MTRQTGVPGRRRRIPPALWEIAISVAVACAAGLLLSGLCDAYLVAEPTGTLIVAAGMAGVSLTVLGGQSIAFHRGKAAAYAELADDRPSIEQAAPAMTVVAMDEATTMPVVAWAPDGGGVRPAGEPYSPAASDFALDEAVLQAVAIAGPAGITFEGISTRLHEHNLPTSRSELDAMLGTLIQGNTLAYDTQFGTYVLAARANGRRRGVHGQVAAMPARELGGVDRAAEVAVAQQIDDAQQAEFAALVVALIDACGAAGMSFYELWKRLGELERRPANRATVTGLLDRLVAGGRLVRPDTFSRFRTPRWVQAEQ